MIEGKFGDITLAAINIYELRNQQKLPQQITQIRQKKQNFPIEIQQPNFNIIKFQQSPYLQYSQIKNIDYFNFDEIGFNQVIVRNEEILQNYSRKYEQFELRKKQQQIKKKESQTTSIVGKQQAQQEYLKNQQQLLNSKLFNSNVNFGSQTQKKKIEATQSEVSSIINFLKQKNMNQYSPKDVEGLIEAFQTKNPEELWRKLQ